MLIWLAYAFDVSAEEGRVEQGLARVAHHYQPVTRVPLVRRGWADQRFGALVWDAETTRTRWPSWTAEGDLAVAGLHAPLSYQDVTGPLEPAAAVVPFARALRDKPQLMTDLVPPFALAVHDRGRRELTLLLDGLGLARVFELRFPGGWVWSNRLGALPIFAGRAPALDERGWRLFAGSGWFMGEATPLAGTRALGPGTVLRLREGEPTRRDEERVDSLRTWAGPRAPAPDALDAAAQSMVDVTRATSVLWDARPVVQLSGGRDSRMVASGVVAADIDVAFTTTASLQGELEVARELLSRTHRPYEHLVKIPHDIEMSGDLLERARAQHAIYDGLIGHSSLRGRLTTGLGPAGLSFSGAGGEISRGSFYRTILGRIERDPVDGPFRRLDRLYRFHGGVRPEVHQAVSEEIGRTLDRGRRIGLLGADLLDWFYLAERIRRWANTNAKPGTVTPLVTPTVIRAGFDTPPQQRIADAMPSRVVERLVPAWADVPFYKATRADFARMTRKRIWETSDATFVSALIDQAERWGDLFEPDSLRKLWRQATAGKGINNHESVFERLTWRAAYDDHLAALAQAARWEPAAVDLG